MAVELEIIWEGEAPGLQDHRLSLGAFGESLHCLLLALRRIATKIVGEAVDGEGPTTGRFANEARQLDILIDKIVGNSSGISSAVALHLPSGQIPLFDSLPEAAGIELLEAVESESKGLMKNAAVRRYLRALPSGVSTQNYTLRDNERIIKQVKIGTMDLPGTISDLPFLKEIAGQIVGVGFEPGRNEVAIKTEDGHIQRLSASPMQVDNALEFRGSVVKAMALMQEPLPRLLKITKAGFRWRIPDREVAIFEKWDGLLRRLAQ
jgi:hypothetical protein